ncbi:TOM1-like protein 2 isoform X2 [Lingula anatina]|uniref:TOM1-like protein 2 isoform X2 n=1 Tax=Lingula anatina TaxID=7574 RepID=A0A1S3IUE9_LINAN|nr:TOM1-like protein 2 isoform X2 [Lingula anatina]|eukprot:XP_013401561.1 TOM1-like protein 2 isoform X2 [Lingula anatina]
MSFFAGNPFTTPVGQRVDQATDASMASENWALNMEICDIINETDEGPRDAIKALRKKLTNNVGKNWTVVMYTLTVLETCVKNCGKRFHILVANKDFLHELVKIIGPKNDPPTVIQEKILSLIQTWSDAFKGAVELKEVEKVYQELKSKGIEFPMTDLDSMAPIHTPARTVPEMDPASSPVRQPSSRAAQYAPQGQYPPQQAPQPQGRPQTLQQQPPPQMMGGPVNLAPEQMAKLRSEVDIVMGNVKVFGEMLTEMTPGQENREDLDLLQELNRTCRQMQQRIVELIEKVANEEVTEELLRVNDDLNNSFLRYERFERYRTGQQTPTSEQVPPPQQPAQNFLPPSYPATQATQPPTQPATASLIDFGDTPSSEPQGANPNDIHVRLANMNVGGNSVSSTLNALDRTGASTAQDEEFDMFAQSRQSFEQNKQQLNDRSYNYDAQNKQDSFTGGLGAAVSAKTNPNAGNLLAKDGDFDEMESWLRTEDGQKPEEPVTSTEFDRFLAERARAAESLPDSNSGSTTRSGRQLQKDETENALFAL